jgi:oligopeptide transport system ATP-binding protein
MDKILEVNDLEVRFHTQDGTIFAVNGVSFSLQKGETLGIVGESGCGKSVTMLSVLRLIPIPPAEITRGAVLFHGQDLLKMDDEEIRQARGKRISMIFQDPVTSLNPVLKINRQISERMQFHQGLGEAQARKRTIELLELVGIPSAADRADDYPHQFSGGMRQRVMIAMALACSPEILIADEPTTALDVTIQAQIVDLVTRLQRELGMAVIWITHNFGVVARIADRINVMYAGYIIERADVRELYLNPRHPYTLGLLRSIPRLNDVASRELYSIEGNPPTLLSLPAGCPFANRCSIALPKCLQENPPLMPTDTTGHVSACWRCDTLSVSDILKSDILQDKRVMDAE